MRSALQRGDEPESLQMIAKTATPAPLGAGVHHAGSGGGIRTPDLWVMSPTSCRCSTPRRALLPLGSRGWGVPAAASPPRGSPPQYSPALRWVTTGFGMGPGGASTLSATGTPHPRSCRGADAPCLRHFCRGPVPVSLRAGRPRALHVAHTPSPHDGAPVRLAPAEAAPGRLPTSSWRGPPRHVHGLSVTSGA